MPLKVLPAELRDANEWIQLLHRHHPAVQGHRFSLMAKRYSKEMSPIAIVGVCVVGRPVSRRFDPSKVLEVTRLATNGYPNACTLLYSAAARVGREMGYASIQTYILQSESGLSLVAAGWDLVDDSCGGGDWSNGGKRERGADSALQGKKKRYAKTLNDWRT